MVDQLNVSLEDAELLDEMALTTELIIAATEAASESVETLPQAQVDQLLGVPEPTIAPNPAAARPSGH